MCICINCHFIKTCELYKVIEKKHGIANKFAINYNSKPFTPKQSIVKNKYIYNQQDEIIKDWDVNECVNFLEKPGNWINL